MWALVVCPARRNLAQGNLNSMPQITASAKSPLARVQRRAAGCYRHLTRH